MPSIMMKLNTRTRALATITMLALLVGLLAAFTLGYTPNPRAGNNHYSRDPAVSKGQLSKPW